MDPNERISNLTPEQIERMRAMVTPPPKPKLTRWKGTLRISNIINALHDEGWREFSVHDIEHRLRELDLVDLWPEWKTEDGPHKSLGDACGGHGLKLPSTPAKKDQPKRYLIPPGGITRAYCEQNRIELVDDPNAEPVAASCEVAS